MHKPSRSLFAVLLMLLSVSLCAEDVCILGICYGLVGTRRAYVKSPDLSPDAAPYYKGVVFIPSAIRHNGRSYTVMSIGESAFAGCDELRAVYMPSTVQAISGGAFIGCSSLTTVSAPAQLQALASGAFIGCTSLRQVPVARHEEVLDTLTYYCCSSLTSAMIPAGVKDIKHGALAHCPSMNDLYCFATAVPAMDGGAFTASDMTHIRLHVPAASLAAYQVSPDWACFSAFVPLTDADYLSHGYTRGDVNDDGIIDQTDIALVQRLIVGLPAEDAVAWAADMNGDGKVNAQDLVLICQQVSAAR